MTTEQNVKKWKARFDHFRRVSSAKSIQEEYNSDASTKHDIQKGNSCQNGDTSLVATDGSCSKEQEDVNSVKLSTPHIGTQGVPLTRSRMNSEPKQRWITNELGVDRHYRKASFPIDCASTADRLQVIRDLNVRARRLTEMNIIEPLDIKKLTFKLLNYILETNSE